MACKFRFGIRLRLILMVTVLIVIVGMILSTFFIYVIRSAMIKDLTARGEVQAKLITKDLAYPMIVRDIKELEHIAGDIINNKEIAYFAVFNEIDKVLVERFNYKYSVKDTVNIKHVVTGTPFDISADEDDLFSLEDSDTKKLRPIGYVSLKMSKEDVSKFVRTISTTVIIFFFITFIVALLLIIVISRYAIKPINRLLDGTKRIAQGDLDFTIPIAGNDEIGDLSSCFNEMTVKLKRTVDGLKNEVIERQKAQDELHKTKSYLDNVVNSMPSILIGIDSQGNIMDMNLEAEKFSGVDNKEAKGLNLVDLIPAISKYMDEFMHSVRSRKTIEKNKVQTVIDGNIKVHNYVAYPLLTNGITGAVIRIDDITEKTRLEDLMVQTEKMMSIGGLAAGMAHEINNPLSSIIQGVQNTFRRLSPDLKKNMVCANKHNIDLQELEDYLTEREIYDFLKGILDAGKRAAEIVRNMLNFSRKSEDKFAIQSMSDILDETLELASHDYDFKKKYDFRKIKIVKDYKKNVPHVACIKSEIQQVILNLLKNGAEIMAEKASDSKVFDYKPTFHVNIFHKKDEVFIEIEDNGPGMNDEVRNRIFEPFFTTKPVGSGTGLGLSVSYFIITQNHKGKMWVESELNKGTKFVIVLNRNFNVECK